MPPGARYLGLFIILILLFVEIGPPSGFGAGTTLPVSRAFYFSSPKALSTTSPSIGNPSFFNFTGTPVQFLSPLLLYPATISGTSKFSLYLFSNKTSLFTVGITQTFSEKFESGSSQNVTSQPLYTMVPGLNQVDLSLSIQQPLAPYGEIAVGLNITSIPLRTNVALLFGSSQTPSSVILPLSGYATLDPTTPVTVLDRQENPSTSFSLNASVGNNIVIFQARVFSAFSYLDIRRINLTIVDPNFRPVRGGTNLTMFAQSPPTPSTPQPYVYVTQPWFYPSNATVGLYQVYIDIFDVQNGHTFSFRGPTSFNIIKPGPFSLPPPFDLLPYFAAGGVVAIGGVAYYRNRKTKRYLAPFDHFNTLTAGELDGGTVSIEGNTGSGKTILSEQLMFEDLKRGKPCVFVSTSDFPSNVRSAMKSMGLDVRGYEQSGLLTFVDGYSAEAGQESTEKFSVPSIGDLTTLGMKISSSLPIQRSKGASLYFDSLVPLASKTKPESIVSFVQSVGAKMKGIGGKAVFTLGPSVDPMVQKQLEDMSDCVVQMEAFEERGVRRRRLKIAKLRARRHQEGWNVFAIEDGKGIIFYSKKPKT
ncbi:MAG TPA: RAD55 family ATPase [Candidatus Bathyarchaeia archaeon]|nr:RAD55 family ATPase [Candidatus Bathyarchaeia archaeon]